MSELRWSSILPLIALILLPSLTHAGTVGVVRGVVVDRESGQALPGANVIIEGSTLGAASDAEGQFEIRNIPVGVYTVRVRMMGYSDLVIKEVKVHPDLKTTLKAEVTATILEFGKELVVTAERPLIQPDVTGSTHAVGGEEIEALPVSTVEEIVALQPGATADGHIRGGRATEVLYLVDGIPVQEMMAGGKATNIPKGAVVEMTVQTGGFNAEYGNAMSGVVNVVTRTGTEKPVIWARGVTDWLGRAETNHYTELEAFVSGPLFGGANYFISGNLQLTDTRWWQDMVPVFGGPVSRNGNLVGKLILNPHPSLRLTLQGLFSDWDWHDYEYRWRFNLDGLPPQAKQSYRGSVSLTHTLSERSFYTLRFSRFQVQRQMGQGQKDDVDARRGFQYQLPYYYFVIAGDRLWWQDTKQIIYTAQGDLTAHVGGIHEFKAGFEGQYYDVFNDLVKYEPHKTFWGRPLIDQPLLNFSTRYRYKPYQFAAYIQDKMDNRVFVANFGLRYEMLDPRAQRPNLEWIPTSTDEFEQEVRSWTPAAVKQQISPRMGISFPITDSGHFFFNFGYFFQIPLFDYMFAGLDFDLKKGVKSLVGNPDLKPERTKAYEMSYRQTVGENVLVSTTVFNKEVQGLIDTKTFLASDSKAEDDGFSQFVNLPFARSVGIEMSLEKRFAGWFGGVLNYTLMWARGYSASAEQGLNYFQWGFEVPNEEHYLSWDQRHTLVANALVGRPGQWELSLLWRFNTPRPYTYYPSREGIVPDLDVKITPNNSRMRNQSYVDIKFSRYLNFGQNLAGQAYADIRNVLDRANVLWIASDGKVGGELGDPTAWDVGRRFNVGVRVRFGKGTW